MRDRPARTIGMKEGIVEYTWHESGLVIVLVGSGDANAQGDFVPLPNQTYDQYIIDGDRYNALMAANQEKGKPSGTFRKDDLWPFIDDVRESMAARIRTADE